MTDKKLYRDFELLMEYYKAAITKQEKYEQFIACKLLFMGNVAQN